MPEFFCCQQLKTPSQKDHAWAVAHGMTDLKKPAVRQKTCDGCHGKIDTAMVTAGHKPATTYKDREAKYKTFAHWNTRPK